jgi:hypothetical protein
VAYFKVLSLELSTEAKENEYLSQDSQYTRRMSASVRFICYHTVSGYHNSQLSTVHMLPEINYDVGSILKNSICFRISCLFCGTDTILIRMYEA